MAGMNNVHNMLRRLDMTHASIPDTDGQHTRKTFDACSFQPYAASTASQQVEMTEYDWTSILIVDEFIEKNMY